jgi:hypothetical protein
MTLNVSCTEGNHPSSGPAGATGNPNAPAGNMADGTTDGNGGNGINGKMYESYIVDPTSLPAYKNLLQPKLEMLLKLAEKEQGTPDKNVNAGYKKMFLSKTWYVAPVSLNTLNKKTIGVEFTKENTEQLAIQTTNEVWINSTAFEKMSEQEQATLLVHEFAMSARMEIKKGQRHVCEMLGGGGCEYFENKPIGTDEMSKEDYQKIRAITAFSMAVNESTSLKSVQDMFTDFFFGGSLMGSKWKDVPGEVHASSSLQKNLLKRAAATGNLNGLCDGKSCQVQVSDGKEDTQLNVTVIDSETSNVIRSFTASINNENSIRKQKHEDTGAIIYTMTYWDSFTAEELKDGSIKNMMTVIASDSNGLSSSSDVVALQLDQWVWVISNGTDADGKPCKDSTGTAMKDKRIFIGDKTFNTPIWGTWNSESCNNGQGK